MIICEKRFDVPDPLNEKYSLLEVDFYAWIPFKFRKTIPDHRLSIRKNLETGKFEVYRLYYNYNEPDKNKIEIAFEGNFEDALMFANREIKKFHGDNEENLPCLHHPPRMDFLCPHYLKKEKREIHKAKKGDKK